MAKKTPAAPEAKVAGDSKSYTSFYLTQDVRDVLEVLTEAAGPGSSRSKVVSSLILAAGTNKQVRLIEITRELADLVGVS